MLKLLKTLIIMGLAMTLSMTESEAGPDPENTLVMELEHGRVVIQMLPEVAPDHVARIKELTRQGFYDGLVFHRVMDGFMAQTGDPTGTGSGGSGQNIKAEFSSEPYLRGTAGMARSSRPDSADSQFFITLAPARFLDNKYTVWGRVIEGMEAVDQIKKAPAGRQSGQVDDPDKILRLRVLADIEE
ncbi:MAG: peptidylprolyl isomerase [Proteobacteria bacterium]|nr:peptidylprolyl isomerase [Pseudomonadota bacterium]